MGTNLSWVHHLLWQRCALEALQQKWSELHTRKQAQSHFLIMIYIMPDNSLQPEETISSQPLTYASIPCQNSVTQSQFAWSEPTQELQSGVPSCQRHCFLSCPQSWAGDGRGITGTSGEWQSASPHSNSVVFCWDSWLLMRYSLSQHFRRSIHRWQPAGTQAVPRAGLRNNCSSSVEWKGAHWQNWSS